jgi:DNA-binding transcriptional regulator LsrR (DeoR family)
MQGRMDIQALKRYRGAAAQRAAAGAWRAMPDIPGGGVAVTDQLRLMTRVARLYHEEGLRQPEIAARLGLSQPKVSRLLKQALDQGIVRISVQVPSGAHPELEERLEARFGLREAVVVDTTVDHDEHVVRGLGAAAASYVERTVRSGEVIGISSWSATLLAMVDAMHPVISARDTRVVQILGGVGSPAAASHAAHLTGRLATLLRGRAEYLPAPGVVGSPEARDVLLQDPFVQATVALFDQVTMALVGIGTVEPSRLLASSGNVFSLDELATVRRQGGVGDVCLRFFDSSGKPLSTPLNDRVLGMDLGQLKCVPRAVGVAGGPRKSVAIRGALEGRLVNCLITDVFTAERLVAA